METETAVCEMCLDAAAEEALATEDERELLCITLGADIADHLCEEIESDGWTRCGCACHGPEKQARRGETAAGGGGT